jgi:hypothetical protein
MAILLSLSDFVDGKYNIPAASSSISANDSELQSYIDDNEKKYIYLLLGVELGDLIIVYLQASRSPANSDYDKIIDAFADSSSLFCHGFTQSLGLKAYLQACIYYEYTKDSYTESLAGTVKQSSEVSSEVAASPTTRKAERVFNSILNTAEAIQSICQSDSTKYAGYSGSRIAVKGHQFFI